MARACKCRHCKTKLTVDVAYKVVIDNKPAYFCNEEHFALYEAAIDAEKETKKTTDADKDKAYRLICDIIGRKSIINTILWKEWAMWNNVASNKIIAQYLEDNKEYLTSIISRLENIEFNRIRYLSAILKNNLGDFQLKANEAEKPKVLVDESFYQPVATRNNKRRSLADLEDEF